MIRVLLILLPLALGIYAFIDCLTTDEKKVRGLPKIVWVFVILLTFPFFIGPVGWLVAGRARGTSGPGRGIGFSGRPRGPQIAPDDNPDFLASLNKDRPKPPPSTPSQDEAEMLKRLEEDLKRREDDLRSPDQDGQDGRAKD